MKDGTGSRYVGYDGALSKPLAANISLTFDGF